MNDWLVTGTLVGEILHLRFRRDFAEMQFTGTKRDYEDLVSGLIAMEGKI